MARTFAARSWRGLAVVAPVGALLAFAPTVATGQLPSVHVDVPHVSVPDVPHIPGPAQNVTGPAVDTVNSVKHSVLPPAGGGNTGGPPTSPGGGGTGGGGGGGGGILPPLGRAGAGAPTSATAAEREVPGTVDPQLTALLGWGVLAR